MDVPARPRASSLRTSSELGSCSPQRSAAVSSLDLGRPTRQGQTRAVQVRALPTSLSSDFASHGRGQLPHRLGRLGHEASGTHHGPHPHEA